MVSLQRVKLWKQVVRFSRIGYEINKKWRQAWFPRGWNIAKQWHQISQKPFVRCNFESMYPFRRLFRVQKFLPLCSFNCRHEQRTGPRLDTCGSRNKKRRCWRRSRENRRSMLHSRETPCDTPALKSPPDPPGQHVSLLWAAIITVAASRDEEPLINGTPARLWIAMVSLSERATVCWRSLEREWMYAEDSSRSYCISDDNNRQDRWSTTASKPTTTGSRAWKSDLIGLPNGRVSVTFLFTSSLSASFDSWIF